MSITRKRLNKNRNSRTKVGTGKKLFLEPVDERKRSARRFRELYDGLVDNLGGPSYMTIGKMQLIRRVTTLAIYAEQMEMDYLIENKKFNLDEYIQISRTHAQLLKLLGLEKKTKDVNNQEDLNSYIKERYGSAVLDGEYEVMGE